MARTVTLTLSSEIQKRLDEDAKRLNMNRSEYVRYLYENQTLSFEKILLSTHKQKIAIKNRPGIFYCNKDVKKILSDNNQGSNFLGMRVRVNNQLDTFFCND